MYDNPFSLFEFKKDILNFCDERLEELKEFEHEEREIIIGIIKSVIRKLTFKILSKD